MGNKCLPGPSAPNQPNLDPPVNQDPVDPEPGDHILVIKNNTIQQIDIDDLCGYCPCPDVAPDPDPPTPQDERVWVRRSDDNLFLYTFDGTTLTFQDFVGVGFSSTGITGNGEYVFLVDYSVSGSTFTIKAYRTTDGQNIELVTTADITQSGSPQPIFNTNLTAFGSVGDTEGITLIWGNRRGLQMYSYDGTGFTPVDTDFNGWTSGNEHAVATLVTNDKVLVYHGGSGTGDRHISIIDWDRSTGFSFVNENDLYLNVSTGDPDFRYPRKWLSKVWWATVNASNEYYPVEGMNLSGNTLTQQAVQYGDPVNNHAGTTVAGLVGKSDTGQGLYGDDMGDGNGSNYLRLNDGTGIKEHSSYEMLDCPIGDSVDLDNSYRGNFADAYVLKSGSLLAIDYDGYTITDRSNLVGPGSGKNWRHLYVEAGVS